MNQSNPIAALLETFLAEIICFEILKEKNLQKN